MINKCSKIFVIDIDHVVAKNKICKTLLDNILNDSFEVVFRDGFEINNSESTYECIWIHSIDYKSYKDFITNSQNKKSLLRYYNAGTNILATGFGSFLAYDLGIEENPPEIKKITIKSNGYSRKAGVHGFLGHPIFESLNNGVYLQDRSVDFEYLNIGYYDEKKPKNGKVVAVEKEYIKLNESNKTIIEHEGNINNIILSIGSYIDFVQDNLHFKDQNKFILNCLKYLCNKNKSSEKTYWEYSNLDFKLDKNIITDQKDHSQYLPEPSEFEVGSGLKLISKTNTDHFIDLSGERIMILGNKHSGIKEIWTHPFRILNNLNVSFEIAGIDYRSDELHPIVEISPELIKRKYEINGIVIEENIFVSNKNPSGCINWTVINVENNVKVNAEFNIDFRYMWPYNSGALGGLRYNYENESSRLVVTDKMLKFSSIYGFDKTPNEFQCDVIKNDTHNILNISFSMKLDGRDNKCANFMFSGSNVNLDETTKVFNKMLKNPFLEYKKSVKHQKNALENYLSIVTPDENFNNGYNWAIAGANSFYAKTPGIGSGLLAGYGLSTDGWDGGQKISGRPGYAWYFGRDSEWSGLSFLGFGAHNIIKDQIKLLRKYQESNGKILHELSLSGIVHNDAADSTPLYIILIEYYLKFTGDLKFVNELQESINMATEYLYSTDYDGDGFIENTKVGHGWIEGGPLYGAHVTFYLASLWVQVHSSLSYLKSHLKELKKIDYDLECKKLQERLNTDFFDQSNDLYYYGKNLDNTFVSESTILTSVGCIFKLLNTNKTEKVLDEFAGNKISTDWGTRILKNNSKNYSNKSYHSGTVWPLFTGWVSTAEYNYEREISGFTHIMDSLNLYKSFSPGYIPEVLNGDRFELQGVCEHQCWSETAVLQPIIFGMLGIEPDAMRNFIQISPKFPADWNKVDVRNIVVGNSILRMSMVRSCLVTTYSFELMSEKHLDIEFILNLFPRMMVSKIVIDEKIYTYELEKNTIKINLKIVNKLELLVHHENGIEVIPIENKTELNSVSSMIKIIRRKLVNPNTLVIATELIGDKDNFIKIKLFNEEIKLIQGAEIVNNDDNNVITLKTIGHKSTNKYIEHEITIKL